MRKRFVSILLACVMIIAIMPCITVPLWADEEEETIATVDGYTVLLPKGVDLPDGTDTATVINITSLDETWGNTGETTWYVATGDISINHSVTVLGDVHLILSNGCDLNVEVPSGQTDTNPAIWINSTSSSLTIYGQSKGTTTGSLTVSNLNKFKIAIGENNSGNPHGDITVNGGKLFAKGNDDTSGVIECNNVTINGGEIKIENVDHKAIEADNNLSINGGIIDMQENYFVYGKNISISGGLVNIYGISAEEKIEISGGTINAGTISGDYSPAIDISGGFVTVNNNDGEFYGILGSAISISETSPLNPTVVNVNVNTEFGICAYSENDAKVTISGGKVSTTSTNNDGYGIYVGSYSGEAIVDISSSEVTAKGGAKAIYSHKVYVSQTNNEGKTIYITDVTNGETIKENRGKDENISQAILSKTYVRISTAVCTIGNNEYNSITSALAADNSNEDETHPTTIKLIADDTENVVIAEKRCIELNLNGYILKNDDGTNNNVLSLSRETSSGEGNGGRLTLIDTNEKNRTHNFKVLDNGRWILTDLEATISYENLTSLPKAGEIIEVSGGAIVCDVKDDNSEVNSLVSILEGATLQMETGSIIGGINSSISDYGNLFLNGGLIAGNNVVEGGVFVGPGGLFKMTGGTIAYNRATGLGAGVSAANSTTFVMLGGTITGNSAPAFAGVVASGSITLGKTAKIYDNTATALGNNLSVIEPFKLATGEDKPSEGMNVGITLLDYDGTSSVASAGAFTTNGAKSDLQYFFSDNSGFHIEYNNTGKCLELVNGHGHGLETEDTSDDIIFDTALTTGITIDGALPENNYYLTEDLDFGDSLVVADNQTVNICLCGHKLTLEKCAKTKYIAEKNSIFIGKDAVLNIYDDNNAGIIDLGESGLIMNNGTLNINAGTIKTTNGHDEVIFSEKSLIIGEDAIIQYAGSSNVISASGEVTLKGKIKAAFNEPDSLIVSNGTFNQSLTTLTINLYDSAVITANNQVDFELHTEEGVFSKIVAKDTLTGVKNYTYQCKGNDDDLDGVETTVVYKDENNKNTNEEFFEYFIFKSQTGMYADIQKANGDIEIKKFIATKQPTDQDQSFETTIESANYEWFAATKATGYLKPADFEKGLFTLNSDIKDMEEANYDGINNTFMIRVFLEGKITTSFTRLKVIIPKATYSSMDSYFISNSSFRFKLKAGNEYITNLNCDTDNGWWTSELIDGYYRLMVYPVDSYSGKNTEIELLDDVVLYEATPEQMDNGTISREIEWYIGPVAFVYENVDVGDKINEGKKLSATEIGNYICKATVHRTSIYSDVYYCKEITKTPTSSVSYSNSNSVVTVPVSGDKDTVKVQATVSGSNATIKNITNEEIIRVGTKDNVVMDLTSLSKSVTGITIPKTTFENVAASEAKGLLVKLPNGVVAVFDKDTLSAVAKQATADNIKLVIDKDTKAKQSLNNAQKDTVNKMNNPVVLDAYFVSNGQRISDFKGGKAEITAAYETTKPIRVWYVADDGTKELIPNTFDGKEATFTVTHFSHYVIENLEGTKYDNCPQDDSCVYARFTDSNPKAWYHDGVHFCVDNGYMNGISKTLFGPNDTLSRAMIVNVLWNIEKNPTVNYKISFKDVKAGVWYTDAIRWAQGNKIVCGYNEQSYGPNDDVTREQLAAILMNYASYKEIDVSKRSNLEKYEDKNLISNWALDSVKWANAVDILGGRTKTTIDPKGNATRAEAASMIQRLCEYVLN